VQRRTIALGAFDRTYWLAVPPELPAPLLVVLHGMGLDGCQMARWTGLADRGPAAGFATVFADACQEVWDDQGFGRFDGADDAAFIRTLVDQLVSEGVATVGALFLVGLSNGAFFAEHLARHGQVEPMGLVLVAGTARVASRRLRPRPATPAAVLMFAGTADPQVPYAGGPAKGLLAWTARRRVRQILLNAGVRDTVAAEVVAADWAATNGCSVVPSTETKVIVASDLQVDRLSWTRSDRPRVVLYRIARGGHGWPGGPQYLPPLLVGRIAHLDATAISLEFAGQQLGRHVERDP